MKYDRITLEYQFNCSRCENRQCTKDGFCCDETFCKTYNRLAELEDKIERGELVDVKENHLIAISRGSGKSSKQLETIDILTKYEQGMLVELPCKVGQEIYEIITSPNGNFISREIIGDFWITEDGIVARTGLYTTDYIEIEEFGKTVFLICEEAEKKLNELHND